LKVEGYTRRTEVGWVFSQDAVDLIQSFIQAFPRLFSLLAKIDSPDGLYLEEDLFPSSFFFLSFFHKNFSLIIALKFYLL